MVGVATGIEEMLEVVVGFIAVGAQATTRVINKTTTVILDMVHPFLSRCLTHLKTPGVFRRWIILLR